MTSKELISQLQLQPHPEGGYFKETYRSAQLVEATPGNSRNICTAIFYLLEGNDFSAFHRIKSDELWFFHQGQALEIISIQDGKLKTIFLGNNAVKGESLQAMVPAGAWFGSRLKGGVGFALVSCTVAPGFDFADFELADRAALISQFPELKKTIEALTRQAPD